MSATGYLQTCEACEHEFRAGSRLVGKRVLCPFCLRPMTIAAPPMIEDPLSGQELAGCKLIRRLGTGSLGVVYEAEQHKVERRVAMKMLSSKAAADERIVERFQREAKLCAQIQHANVVGIYDFGFDRNVHYLTMEYVNGTTMSALIDESGRMPLQHSGRLMLQVARALEHVHSLGIVHRDIKPANILVNSQGVAKLADLGLAKKVDLGPNDQQRLITMQGMVLGSPAYMPPEQIQNAREVTKAADIYALGATFYHALTGAPPFDGVSGLEVMTKVLRDQTPPVERLAPGLPKGVAELITRMLDKDPAKRPQDASTVIIQLEDILYNLSRSSAPAPAKPKRTGFRLLVCVLLLANVALWLFLLARWGQLPGVAAILRSWGLPS